MQMSQLLTNKPWIGKFSSIYNRPDSSWLAAGFRKVFCRHIFIDLLGFCALKNGAGKKVGPLPSQICHFQRRNSVDQKNYHCISQAKKRIRAWLSPTTNSSELDNGLLATYAQSDKEARSMKKRFRTQKKVSFFSPAGSWRERKKWERRGWKKIRRKESYAQP